MKRLKANKKLYRKPLVVSLSGEVYGKSDTLQGPPAPTSEPVSEQKAEPDVQKTAEPKTKVPDAPKPKKTGKVPDFKVN